MKRYLLLATLSLLLFCSANGQQAVFNTTPYIESLGGATLSSLCSGDLDGDHLIDLVGTIRPPVPDKPQIFVWLQGQGGKLQAPLQFTQTEGNISCLAVSDLFNDGTPEIIAGVGSYIKIFSFANGSIIQEDKLQMYSAYINLTGVNTGDFDNDGFTDIAVSYGNNTRFTILYQKGEANSKWDIRHYTITGVGYQYVKAVKFGPLQQTAAAFITSQSLRTISVKTFTSLRTLQNEYTLTVPGTLGPTSLAVVKKGKGNPQNELWVTFGGNKPSSRIGIWRGLQDAPDSIINVTDIPESIQSANLDCDEDEEPVILHGGWQTATLFIDSAQKYVIPYTSHYEQDGLTLADVNNDGKKDICYGSWGMGLIIYYNITPNCWPADVSAGSSVSKEFSIYPNPADGEISIESSTSGILQITDAQGRIVYKSAIKDKIVADVHMLANGVYFVMLYTPNGEVLTGKLIKN